MSLIAKEKGGSMMELIPQGVHVARCVSVIDLGTQTIEYKDQIKDTHQVRFEFELPHETYTFKDKETEEEKTGARIIGTNFTVSLNAKATLRKFLESWRGKKFTAEELEGFNLGQVLGKVCQLQVIHSDDGKYANISNALPLMKGMSVPESERELLIFGINEDDKGNIIGYDEDVLNKLPEWLQNKISESKEMREIFGIVSLDEQEKEIEKEIASKQMTPQDAEDIFQENELPKEEPKSVAQARAASKTSSDDEFV